MYSDIVMLKYSNDHFNRKDKMCLNVYSLLRPGK